MENPPAHLPSALNWPDRFAYLALDDLLSPRIKSGQTVIIDALSENRPMVGQDVLLFLDDGWHGLRQLLAFSKDHIQFGDGLGRQMEEVSRDVCSVRSVCGVMYRHDHGNQALNAKAERLRCERLTREGIYPQPDWRLMEPDPLTGDALQAIEALRAKLKLQ